MPAADAPVPDPPPAGPGPARYGRLLLIGVALGMHMAVGALYALTALIAPGWAAALLGVWWLVLLIAGLAAAARRPWSVFGMPAVALLTWILALWFGDHVLGWKH